jgi:hypothetical protein
MSALLPFTFAGLDRSLYKALEAELRMGWEMERVRTAIYQTRIARETGERKAIDGLGRLRMELDPLVWLHWRLKEGPEVFKDPAFKRALERDNPEVRVRCHGTKVQVGPT